MIEQYFNPQEYLDTGEMSYKESGGLLYQLKNVDDYLNTL